MSLPAVEAEAATLTESAATEATMKLAVNVRRRRPALNVATGVPRRKKLFTERFPFSYGIFRKLCPVTGCSICTADQMSTSCNQLVSSPDNIHSHSVLNLRAAKA
jgi:hypothetical protein